MPFPVETTHVEALESRLGSRLPALFRDGMIRSNGGEFDVEGESWWLHPIADPSTKKRLARTWDDIGRQTTAARSAPGFPADAVAIAENGAGDRLMLLPDPEVAGVLGSPVYRWDHETGDAELVAEEVRDLLDRRPG